MGTRVLEEILASIFRNTITFKLNIAAESFSQALVVYNTRRRLPRDDSLHNYCWENFKPRKKDLYISCLLN